MLDERPAHVLVEVVHVHVAGAALIRRLGDRADEGRMLDEGRHVDELVRRDVRPDLDRQPRVSLDEPLPRHSAES